jgi:hypothetical protein
MTDRVTRAEAARVLGLDKSTITRWVQSHPALLDDAGRVSVDEMRRHRDTVINVKLQTRGAGDQASLVPSGRPAPRAPAAAPSINDHRSRTEAARAETAELDLAERLGRTLWREDVEKAVIDAAEVLQKLAGQLARDQAERLARIDDVRAMERALEDLMRALLTEGARALTEAADGEALAHAG